MNQRILRDDGESIHPSSVCFFMQYHLSICSSHITQVKVGIHTRYRYQMKFNDQHD